jgi:hypothetical protein
MSPLIVSGIIGGLAVLVVALVMPQMRCSECQTPLPKFGRKHARPGLWGGWICPNCKSELNRWGKKVKPKKK